MPVSVLDDGRTVKGLLFAQGLYRPFQDFGPLTNHMPLAFFVPGWVEMIWDEGIRSGRFYALTLGLVMLFLLWRTCRRVGNPAWSALAVWGVALNASLVKIYSQAISQVLVITLIMGMLFLGLGSGRKLWQTTLAAVLAGALWMTRINLLAVLPLFIVYLWLSHGRRVGIPAIAGGRHPGPRHLLAGNQAVGQVAARWTLRPLADPPGSRPGAFELARLRDGGLSPTASGSTCYPWPEPSGRRSPFLERAANPWNGSGLGMPSSWVAC
jgi:hypothetical protein